MNNDDEKLFQKVKTEIDQGNTILAKRILKSKKHSPELKHEICKVFIELGVKHEELNYLNIVINCLEKIKKKQFKPCEL